MHGMGIGMREDESVWVLSNDVTGWVIETNGQA